MLRMHRITPIQTTVKVNAGKYSRSIKLWSTRSEIQQQRTAYATVIARVVWSAWAFVPPSYLPCTSMVTLSLEWRPKTRATKTKGVAACISSPYNADFRVVLRALDYQSGSGEWRVHHPLVSPNQAAAADRGAGQLTALLGILRTPTRARNLPGFATVGVFRSPNSSKFSKLSITSKY